MMSPLDSQQLLAFVTVARERSFSNAARQLGRTQSAVSQSIARLERELGERLFVRNGRATRLTAAGLALLEHARKVLEEMELVRSRFHAREALQEGELLVGTSDTLACYLLPPVFAAYRQRYPGVELRIDNRPSPATATRVATRQVDVGIVTLPLPQDLEAGGRRVTDGLDIEELVAQPEVVICPPRHPLARRKWATVETLLAFPLLLLDRSTGSRSLLDSQLSRLGPRPQIAMEMSSVEVLKRLVELGFGVSVVPELAVKREVGSGTLAMVRLHGIAQERRVGIATPGAVPLPPAVAAFVEIARDTLAAKR